MSLRTYVADLKRSLGSGLASNGASEFSMWSNWDTSWQVDKDAAEYLKTSLGVSVSVRYRSSKLASVPIRFHKVAKDGKKTAVMSGELFDLFQKVNPNWTARRLFEMSEISLCLWGETFWFLDRGTGSKGRPQEIWWAHPDRVKVIPSSTSYISHFEYTPKGGGKPIRFEREETFWARYPNPDNEYEGLSPLWAAMLSADIGTAAMRSNAKMFSQGMQLAGFVAPPKGDTWTKEQGAEIEASLSRRFSGANKAHKWAVIAREMQFQSLTLSPKDTEFIAALKLSFEDICRCFGLSPDLLGGERTFANAAEARLAFWQDTMMPECAFLADEITEQILPLFPGQADIAEFDLSGIDVLQEVEDAKWDRENKQINEGVLLPNEWREKKGLTPVPWGDLWWAPTAGGGVGPVKSDLPPIAPNSQIQFGGLTINELRKSQGLKPVPWGDAWWAPSGTTPVTDDTPPEQPAELAPPTIEELPPDTTKALKSGQTRAIAFGSEEHMRLWRAFTVKSDKHEAAIAATTKRLMQNQRKSVLAKLKAGRSVRVADKVDPFDKPQWVKKFREEIRPVLTEVVRDTAQEALDDIPKLDLAFNVKNPETIRFLEQRAQRFAVEVNNTTWEQLQGSLGEGLDAGESLDDLAARVEKVMGDRIRSSATTIARTEAIGSMNGGAQLAWEQSGVVKGKEWLAALDERTRETHVEAHGQRRLLDEDFDVGEGSGPQPGDIGLAEEDVNCRCTSVAILDVDWKD